MMIKAIIFDFGGVYYHGTFRSAADAVERRFPKKNVMPVILAHFGPFLSGEIGRAEFWERVAKGLPPGVAWQDVREAFHAPLRQKGVNSAVEKLTLRLKKRYKVGLLSNMVEESYREHEAKGHYRHFSYAIHSWKEGIVKPDPRAFHLILKRMGVQPHEAVFVDDQEKNTRVASELGMHAVLFKNATQLKRELKRLKVQI